MEDSTSSEDALLDIDEKSNADEAVGGDESAKEGDTTAKVAKDNQSLEEEEEKKSDAGDEKEKQKKDSKKKAKSTATAATKKKSRTAATSSTTTNDANGLSHYGQRERKKVERFSAQISPTNKKKEHVDVPGKGDKLKDIPYIVDKINKSSAAVEGVYLHLLCFGEKGKKNEVKKHIKEFSGFPFDADSDEFQKRKARLMKLDVKFLKPLSTALGVHGGKNKEERVNNLMEFCLKPEDTGRKPSKSKRSSSSSKRKGEESKAKKSSAKSSSKANKRKHEDSENSEDGDEGDSAEDDVKPPQKRSRVSKNPTPSKKFQDSDKEVSEDDDEVKVGSKEQKSKGKSKKTPAKKSASKSKPKKKASKKMSQSDDEQKSDSEHDDADTDQEDLDITKISDGNLKRVVERIMKKADLNEFTMKTMMEEMKKKFKAEQLEGDKKALIRSFVDEVLAKRTKV